MKNKLQNNPRFIKSIHKMKYLFEKFKSPFKGIFVAFKKVPIR